MLLNSPSRSCYPLLTIDLELTPTSPGSTVTLMGVPTIFVIETWLATYIIIFGASNCPHPIHHTTSNWVALKSSLSMDFTTKCEMGNWVLRSIGSSNPRGGGLPLPTCAYDLFSKDILLSHFWNNWISLLYLVCTRPSRGPPTSLGLGPTLVVIIIWWWRNSVALMIIFGTPPIQEM